MGQPPNPLTSVQPGRYPLTQSRPLLHARSGPLLLARLQLLDFNPDRSKNILLILISIGGSIEPAYQISKLCRAFSRDKFIVAIPRRAKSAATLIALGADEIHLGKIGELGPIDPQLGGLPALGVLQAIETIARISEDYPRSAEMFSNYLHKALTVEQIGYCERIGESAVQYAERLLSTKEEIRPKAHDIAQALVYEYKDHGFVIDQEEAKERLGESWVITESEELRFAESFYQQIEIYNLFLTYLRNKNIQVVGAINKGIWVFDNRNRR